MKQAEMRLKSAQSELKDKERSSKGSGQAYSKDKAALEAIQKEISRIEVRYNPDYCIRSMFLWFLFTL